jgi:uncharacterized protein YqeY
VSLLETIKVDSLKARKEKDSIKASLLTTLYSEALMVGKNKRNDVPTDEETQSTIKKFVKNANDMKTILEKSSFPDKNESLSKVVEEINILESYLPKMLTDDVLKDIISGLISNEKRDLGSIMKALKNEYNDKYDGKKASDIAKNLIGV